MDKRMEDIYENIKKHRLTPDSVFMFHCTMCGDCCRNRDDILLNSKDLFNLAKGLKIATLVYPFNATYQDVEYYISGKNCEFVRNGNIVTVTLIHLETNDDGFAADKQASITVKAVADGVEFYKTYVFHKFDLADENDIVFNPDGKTFKTSGRFDFSIMLPENITYKALSVTIDEEVKNALGVEFNFDNKTNSGYITANYPGTIPVHVISL